MKKETKMEINKENALKLWASRFGKKQKVKDFAGREIMRSAYDDRNSKYGWNIDHILPQSQGGKSTESNLICCSILTNDEKQDSFPCFSANDRDFEIRRVQNHFEIFEKNKQQDADDSVNFFSAAEGMNYFNSLLENGANLFYCCVSINLELKNEKFSNAICEFIRKMFTNLIDDSIEIVFGDISGKNIYNYSGFYISGKKYSIYILNRNCTTKEQVQSMLDTCVLLNTYLISFVGKYLNDYGIYLATEPVGYDFCAKDSKNVLLELGMSVIARDEHLIIDGNTKMNINTQNKKLTSYYINDRECYTYDYVMSEVNVELNKI